MTDRRVAAEDPRLRVAEAIGGLMEFWGFKRNMGRVWTVLYLRPAPMSAAELGDLLSMSAGAVSMTTNGLVRWGVIKKSCVPGERRDYFEPETSIWKMVSRVFRERELAKVRDTIETFEQAIAALRKEWPRTQKQQRTELQFALDRINSLLALARIGERLLTTVLSGDSIDASPLIGWLTGDKS